MLDIISQKKQIIRNALTKSGLISVKFKFTLGATLFFFFFFHYYGKLSFVLFVFTPIKGRK